MMKRKYLVLLLPFFIFTGLTLFASEEKKIDEATIDQLWKSQQEALKKQWNSQKETLDKKWNDASAQMDKEWDRLIQQQDEEEAQLKAEIEQKWQQYIQSTEREWVAYNQTKDAMSRVDFEKGKVVLEVILEENGSNNLETARHKIEAQSKMVFGQEDLSGKQTLGNQIVSHDGSAVGPENLNVYLKEDVLPEVVSEPNTYESKDGVKRRRYTVQINLVSDHIKVRAKKYLPIVEKNAERFILQPQLVMAMIHTESHFNPKAKSPVNAIGMMQILPRFAGREAYRAIYGEDKIISREYLLNPENNIELGCAYLDLLKNRYFKKVDGETKKRYVTICGYNAGPTFIRRKIVNQYPISTMTDKDLYLLLKEKTPKETRDYIDRVIERISLYAVK